MSAQPFNWSAYQSLATELAKQTEEAALRSAVSRAYYYAYHIARARLMDNGFALLPGQDSHKQVWEKFSSSADFGCRKLAEKAKRLKDKRQTADYDPYFARIEQDGPALVDLATQISTDLANIHPDLPRNLGVTR